MLTTTERCLWTHFNIANIAQIQTKFNLSNSVEVWKLSQAKIFLDLKQISASTRHHDEMEWFLYPVSPVLQSLITKKLTAWEQSNFNVKQDEMCVAIRASSSIVWQAITKSWREQNSSNPLSFPMANGVHEKTWPWQLEWQLNTATTSTVREAHILYQVPNLNSQYFLLMKFFF